MSMAATTSAPSAAATVVPYTGAAGAAGRTVGVKMMFVWTVVGIVGGFVSALLW